ncbi:hypothetical protein L0F63_002968 [Massospora cicadina]|nr:hypothetical protein L0F63_002968 [Massospora cicadina]
MGLFRGYLPHARRLMSGETQDQNFDTPPPYTRYADPKYERVVSHLACPRPTSRHLREFSQPPLLSGFAATRTVTKVEYSFRKGVMRQVQFLKITSGCKLEFIAKLSLISTTLDSLDHHQLGALLSASEGSESRWILRCTLPHPVSTKHTVSTLAAIDPNRYCLTLLFKPEPVELEWVHSNNAYELTHRNRLHPPVAYLTLDSVKPSLRFLHFPADSDALHYLLSATHILFNHASLNSTS